MPWMWPTTGKNCFSNSKVVYALFYFVASLKENDKSFENISKHAG